MSGTCKVLSGPSPPPVMWLQFSCLATSSHNSCSILQSHNRYLQPFLLASHNQSQWRNRQGRSPVALVSLPLASVQLCGGVAHCFLQPPCTCTALHPASPGLAVLLPSLCLASPHPHLHGTSPQYPCAPDRDSYCFPLDPCILGLRRQLGLLLCHAITWQLMKATHSNCHCSPRITCAGIPQLKTICLAALWSQNGKEKKWLITLRTMAASPK